MDSLNIDQKSIFFRCIENQCKNEEINDESFTKRPIRGINSMRYLHQDGRKTWLEISKMKSYGKYSKATICRHMVQNIGNLLPDKWKQNQGRSANLLDRQKRNVLHQGKVLQGQMGNFSMKIVVVRAGISPSVHTATIRRVMRKAGLNWSHAQKKRVLTKSDLKLRLKFGWKFAGDFWFGGVGFYLDGASFTQKMNPFDHARALRAMVWRKPGQGLDLGFTAKGSHEGTGGIVAHFMAAIAYGKEVIAAEQYFGRIRP